MAKFCTQCGKELNENGLCPVCNQQSAPSTNPVPAAISVPAKDSGRITAWGVFGLLILFSLPFIGFIAAIIFALAPSNKNLKSFARGYLLYVVIFVIIASLIIGLVATLVRKSLGNADEITNNITNGDYSSLEEALDAIEDEYNFDFGDVFGNLQEGLNP